MPDSYSVHADRVVSTATIEARQLDHPRVGTEHLLLGLLSEEGSVPAEVLQAAGASLAAARHMVAQLVTADAGSLTSEALPLTPRAQRALERAGRFSRREREPEVTAGYVLLGVLDVEGLACQVLRGLAVDIVQLRNVMVATCSDVAPVRVDETRSSEPVRPRCPRCRAALDDTLVETLVAARHEARPPTQVSVVSCAACGATLGVLRPEST